MSNDNENQKLKTVIVFHHTDLDGMGVKILGKLYANKLGCLCETYRCNYNDVNEKVLTVLNSKEFDNVSQIIIGDISVNEQVAKYLNNLYKIGVPIMLRDHHDTAKELNKYEWAFVTEKIDGISRCGTWLLYRELSDTLINVDTFVHSVDDWDTWKWVENNNTNAKKLNTLLQVVGEEVFTDYVLHLLSTNQINKPRDLFTNWANNVIDGHEQFVQKTAKTYGNCMKLVELSLKGYTQKYITGIIFCNHDISDVANIILEEHPEVDILMIVGLPRNISFRTRKDLEIPLGEIAKATTGSGGGHPKSAGSVISREQFESILFNMIGTLSSEITINEIQ